MSTWMIASNTDGDYLSHHQRPGAHWGIRLGPPYPLSRNSDGSLNTKKQAERKRNSTQPGGGQGRNSAKQEGLFSRKTPEEKKLEKVQALKNRIEKNKIQQAECKRLWADFAEKAENEDAIADGLQNKSNEYWADHDGFVRIHERNKKKIEKLEVEIANRNPNEAPKKAGLFSRKTAEEKRSDLQAKNEKLKAAQDNASRMGTKYAEQAENHKAIAEGYRKKSEGYRDEFNSLERENNKVERRISKLNKQVKKLQDEKEVNDVNNEKLQRVRDINLERKETTLMDYVKERNAATQNGLFSRQTPEQKASRQIERQDQKWVKRNADRAYKQAYRKSRSEMNEFVRRDLNKRISQKNANGKTSMTYVNEYNRKLAEIMNKNSDRMEAPSGRVVKFIPKRGEYGVHVALADPSANLKSYNRGIYGDGRVAYRQEHVNQF